MFLFAQSADNPANVALIAVGAFAAVCVFVFGILILSFRFARFNRELLHAERMRSVEAGVPWEADSTARHSAKFMHNAFWISFWIVVGVPSAAFSAASAVTRDLRVEMLGLGIAAWIGAAMASVAAVVCATVLMILARSRTEPSPSFPAKPKALKTP